MINKKFPQRYSKLHQPKNFPKLIEILTFQVSWNTNTIGDPAHVPCPLACQCRDIHSESRRTNTSAESGRENVCPDAGNSKGRGRGLGRRWYWCFQETLRKGVMELERFIN